MEQVIFQVIWLCCYWYYAEQMGSMEKGFGRRVLGICLTGAVLAVSFLLPLFEVRSRMAAAWMVIAGILMLYDLFFDAEPFEKQWRLILLPGLIIAAFLLVFGTQTGVFPLFSAGNSISDALLPDGTIFVLHGGIMLVFLLLLGKKRESLKMWNGALLVAAYGLLSAFSWLLGCTQQAVMTSFLRNLLLWGCVLVEALLFLAVEGTLFFYKKGFDFRTEQFRTELMEHQYDEIKSVYMDMRGWRHDYHNHMQVMKAQLALGNIEGIQEYLDELERELDRVDTFVRSGNLMVDAILNSKLTLARRQKIKINCKTKVPERISVEDVDLCVILGNLLDNALEACALVEEERRFLRVYMTVHKSQLYFSVQNAAKEEPDFEARNYITRKRGNHGLGMKRVQAAVDKYDGYLRLANEAGIFAAEVTMPLLAS